MLFDLSKLHGTREHIERILQPSAFDPPDEEYRVAAPVEVSLDIQKAGGVGFNVSGRVRTRLELECSRCVEPFEVPIDADFDLRYIPQSENAGEGEREIADDDLATAYYQNGVLDLTDLVREQFVLALPMKPLHDEACRGLCPECGANLNRVDCGHARRWEDPRLAPLRGLLIRQKEN
jgi:uncharacterized protein